MAYSGKYLNRDTSGRIAGRRNRSKAGRKRLGVLLLALMMGILLVCGSAATIAWLQTGNSLSNHFSAANAGIEVQETFGKVDEAYQKKNVSIKNTGDTAVYIRAKILACTVDENGNILTSENAQVGTVGYTLVLGASSNWLKDDNGYYYYKLPIEAQASTETLVENCTTTEARFQLNIYVQSLQAAGGAVATEWDVYLDEQGAIQLTEANA